eukprot:435338-Rhodomonas_salina.2
MVASYKGRPHTRGSRSHEPHRRGQRAAICKGLGVATYIGSALSSVLESDISVAYQGQISAAGGQTTASFSLKTTTLRHGTHTHFCLDSQPRNVVGISIQIGQSGR